MTTCAASRCRRIGRQGLGGGGAAFQNRVEADLPRVADPFLALREGVAVVEVRSVNSVSRAAQLDGEGEGAARQALCVLEKDDSGPLARA